MNMSPTTRTASKKHIYRNLISSIRDRIDKEFNLKYQVVVITSLSSALRDVLFFLGLTSIFSHSQQLDNVSIQFNFTTPPPASGDLALQTKQYTPSTMEGSNTILNNRTNWENTSEKGEFVLTVWTPATDKGICFTFLLFCTDSKLLSKFINYFTATRKTKKKKQGSACWNLWKKKPKARQRESLPQSWRRIWSGRWETNILSSDSAVMRLALWKRERWSSFCNGGIPFVWCASSWQM